MFEEDAPEDEVDDRDDADDVDVEAIVGGVLEDGASSVAVEDWVVLLLVEDSVGDVDTVVSFEVVSTTAVLDTVVDDVEMIVWFIASGLVMAIGADELLSLSIGGGVTGDTPNTLLAGVAPPPPDDTSLATTASVGLPANVPASNPTWPSALAIFDNGGSDGNGPLTRALPPQSERGFPVNADHTGVGNGTDEVEVTHWA